MNKWKREYFSIPNILGYFRLVLAGVYLAVCIHAETKNDYYIAAVIIGISMLSDFLDGKIARHFHMVTAWGKILDPIADKITLFVVGFSFVFRYPFMETVIFIFVIKEIFMGISGLLLMQKGWRTAGATWPGKICTAGLYGISFLLLVKPDLKIGMVNVLLLAEVFLMLFALISYVQLYARVWRELGRKIPAKEISMQVLARKLREENKKYRRILMTAVIVFGGYVLVGAIWPFTRQPAVTEQTENQFDPLKYYGQGIGADRARILEDNEEALQERLRMIANAKERVVLSTFDFRTDESGLDMLAALLDAADRGVKVEVFADGFNSWINMEGNPYFYALSTHPNGKIILYNKINLLKPWNIMGRMHDKYLIADDIGYILGGRNTFNYFLGDYGGWKNYDRDVLVYHSGEEESSLREVEAYYRKITSLDYCSIFHDREKRGNSFSVKKAAGELRKRYSQIKEEQPDLFNGNDYYEAHTFETKQIHLLSNPMQRYAKEPVLFNQMMKLIEKNSGQSVIHTPYAICNSYMYEELSRLGDKVTLLQNSPENNGNMFAATDYLRHKKDLIDTGVRLLEYEGGISYHGKSVAIGDELSLIGSFNMDMRSAYIDTELMLVIDSEAVNRQLRENMKIYEKEAATVESETEYSHVPEGVEMKPLSLEKKAFRFFLGGVLEQLRFLL